MDERREFHIDRSISVGHIITTLVIFCTMIMYFTAQDKRISYNEQQIEFLKGQRSEDMKRIEKSLDEIKAMIKAMPR